MKLVQVLNVDGYKDFLTKDRKYEVLDINNNTIYIVADNNVIIGVDKSRFREFERSIWI